MFRHVPTTGPTNSENSPPIMPPSVFERVESLLKQHGISFTVLRHEPVYTSEEAARVRGTPLAAMIASMGIAR